MWTCTARASHNVSTRTTAKARETSARTVRLRREVLVELVQRDTPRVVRARRLREEERRGGVGGEHTDEREEAELAGERALLPARPATR